MSLSDAAFSPQMSLRSVELWNDGPMVQATLAQMQNQMLNFQSQMQHQLQQLQQVQSLPQPPCSFLGPVWPHPLQPQPPLSMENSTQSLDVHNQKAKVRHRRLGKRERAKMKAALPQRSSFKQHSQKHGNEGDSESDCCKGFQAVKESEVQTPRLLLQSWNSESKEEKNENIEDTLAAIQRDIQECLSVKYAMQSHFDEIISDSISEIRQEVQTAVISMKNEMQQALFQSSFEAKCGSDGGVLNADISVKMLETSMAEMKMQMDQHLQIEREERESSVAALALWVTGSLSTAEQKTQKLHSLAASEVKELKRQIKELQELSEKAKAKISEIVSEVRSSKDELEQLRHSVSLMIPACVKPDALHDAIQHGHDGRNEAMDLLKLPEIPGLNVLDSYKQSLLHDAINMNLPEVAVELLRRPGFGQVNAKDYAGRTCLHLAARYGYLNVCQCIVSRKCFCELKAVTTYGQNALDVAQQFDHEDVVKLLQGTGL